VILDKDNNFVPCLAESWRWIDERTIEFRLRRGVTFQDGEKFDAEAVRVNWEAYKALEASFGQRFLNIPDETVLEIVDDYIVRFAFPEPDGMALVKFAPFVQVSPAFLARHKFREMGWGSIPGGSGPVWTGPFKFVEGFYRDGKYSDRLVVKAYEGYWDKRYPKVKTVIFDTTKDKEEAMRLCRETEGAVDIVSFIRPLDTLKVATSPFAKVVKSRDSVHTHGGFNQRKRDSKWRWTSA
jgi:peptide/nickel transport system substrate-binding protein